MANKIVAFKAPIKRVGVQRCVEIPTEKSQPLGSEVHPAVVGRIQGREFESTLSPRVEGGFRLFIHSDIWRRLKLKDGDVVSVEVQRVAPRGAPPIPPELAEALENNDRVARAYAAFTPSLQRQVIRWLYGVKSEEARERRLERWVLRMEETADKPTKPARKKPA